MSGLIEEKAMYKAPRTIIPKQTARVTLHAQRMLASFRGLAIYSVTISARGNTCNLKHSIQGVLQFRIFQGRFVRASTYGLNASTDKELRKRWM
jgi:hypothetical protein